MKTPMLVSRSFNIGLAPLSATESIALECLKQIADEGREATQDEISAGIGSSNECGSTATGTVNRLVAKGYVEHVAGHPLQRAIWIRIVATGQVTAQPRCTSAHWRYRTERVTTPAIQTVRDKAKPVAAMIEAEARLVGKSLTDFLADLVYVGWHEYSAEKEAQ